MKSYIEMNYVEILAERNRVLELVKQKNAFSRKQNKKYLEKLNKEIDEYERNIGKYEHKN